MMTTGTESGTARLALRREAFIQLGLGAAALAGSGLATRCVLLGCVTRVEWIGILGVTTLAIVFLGEGWRAYRTFRWVRAPVGVAVAVRPRALKDARTGRGDRRRGRSSFLLVFGLVASVSAPGVNVLFKMLVIGRAAEIDLVVWVLLVLPVCLAVWLLPPRPTSQGLRP